VKLLATVVTAGALAAGLHVTLKTDGAHPKAGAKWHYTVHSSAPGTLTAQIVDPLGTKHPVGSGVHKGNVTNVAIKGTYSDWVIWPSSSIGFPLTFRVTVKAGGATKVVNTTVTVTK
jgi:hypothetical protein